MRITKQAIGSFLVYGGLGAIVMAFISFRVVHLHRQYRVLETKLCASKQQAEQSQEDITSAKKLLALVQENAQRLAKEHELALVAMVDKHNKLHNEVKTLKARNDIYVRQLRVAQKERMPKQQLVISKALFDEKLKKLLEKANQAMA